MGVGVRVDVPQWRRRLGLQVTGGGGRGRLLAGQRGDGLTGEAGRWPGGQGDGEAAPYPHTVLRGDGGLEGPLLQLRQLLNRGSTLI